jgi:hypothetical protein
MCVLLARLLRVSSQLCVCVCACVRVYVCAHTLYTHTLHTHTPGSSVSIADLETLGSKWCSLDWSFVEKTGDEGTSQACVSRHLLFLTRSISRSLLTLVRAAARDVPEHGGREGEEDVLLNGLHRVLP